MSVAAKERIHTSFSLFPLSRRQRLLKEHLNMALNYETLIRAVSKSPEQRTTTEINDFIVPWLKQSLKKKQGIFQKISDGKINENCPLNFR